MQSWSNKLWKSYYSLKTIFVPPVVAPYISFVDVCIAYEWNCGILFYSFTLINVETAKPIGPTFLWQLTCLRKGYGGSRIKNICLQKNLGFRKNPQNLIVTVLMYEEKMLSDEARTCQEKVELEVEVKGKLKEEEEGKGKGKWKPRGRGKRLEDYFFVIFYFICYKNVLNKIYFLIDLYGFQ